MLGNPSTENEKKKETLLPKKQLDCHSICVFEHHPDAIFFFSRLCIFKIHLYINIINLFCHGNIWSRQYNKFYVLKHNIDEISHANYIITSLARI